ncbi:hypothetical protein ASALC70_00515 [Alcanivorax sp. ALC70]|nr:hypothetical protein ASALC70_00515 [Alcanivorax sp. ALC70]
MSEVQHAVADAVLGEAVHAPQQVIEAVQFAAEGEEIQAVLGGGAVRHGAAPDFLRHAVPVHVGAAHVGVVRHAFIVEFHGVGLGAAEHVFLVGHRHFVESLQAGVHPFLAEHPAAAGGGMGVGDDGGLAGGLPFRVADAIDEAAQVAQVVVDEGFHLQLQGQFIAQLAVHRQAGVEQVAAVVRLHPDEQVALGGGHLALQVEGGEIKVRGQARPEPGAEGHQHRRALAGQGQGLAQGPADAILVVAAAEGVLEKQMLGVAAVENPRLML